MSYKRMSLLFAITASFMMVDADLTEAGIRGQIRRWSRNTPGFSYRVGPRRGYYRYRGNYRPRYYNRNYWNRNYGNRWYGNGYYSYPNRYYYNPGYQRYYGNGFYFGYY